ncbi:MAG: zinc ribbon domain-containing protein [Kiritimatiellae bacterium]|nr:zinc ribbon domain-containing protein [Kiritimatiellia bacterium]
MPECPSCSAQVLAEDRFCPACGKAIAAAPGASAEAAKPPVPSSAAGATSEATTPSTAPHKRPWRQVGCGCLTALALGLVLILGVATWLTQGAKVAAKNHLNLIKTGHAELAYRGASTNLQATASLEQYVAMLDARPLLRDIERIGIPECNRDNDVAELTARLRFVGGLKADVPMRFGKEDGKWRLTGIDLSNVPVENPSGTSAQPSVPAPDAQRPAAPQPPDARPPAPATTAAPAEALSAARAYLNLIVADELELSYRRASADFQATVPLKSYLAIIRERPVLREIAKIDFTAFHDAQDTLILRAHLQPSDGRRFDVPLRLRNEDGHWRVLATDWSNVPVGRQPGATTTPSRPTAPTPKPAATKSAARGERSVGTVVIGAGRNRDGTLVRPGRAVPSDAERISADIQLVNHVAGDRVRVWIERVDGSARTEAIESAIDGQGSGYVPFELKLGSDGIPAGAYRLMVRLGDDRKFATAFDVE